MRMASKKFLRLASVALLIVSTPCGASTISTQWGDLAMSVGASIESYAKRHNGELPPDLDHLYTEEHNEALKEQLGGALSEKIVYFRETLPPLDNTPGAKIIATISFPINEDRRDSLGRYIIYKKPDGGIDAKWAPEKVIQTSVSKANVSLPEAAVYNEKPLKPLDPGYAARLVEDAVKQYGMSAREATDKVNKHLAAVLNGKAKEAKTWAEVVTNQPPAAPPTTTPRAATMPQSTPRPAASALPKSTVETKSPSSFPIVPVAILALAIIGVIVVLLRRKSP